MDFKVICTLVALFVACAAAGTDKAPLLAADSPTAIDGEYIVVLKEELSNDDVEGHKMVVRQLMRFHNNVSKIQFEYEIGKQFRGYSIFCDEKVMEMIRTMKEVKYIERSQVMKAFQRAECEYQNDAEWGLHRTVVRDMAGNEFYHYNAAFAGDGVDCYIIDTGIYLEHSEFSGRARWGFDAVDSRSPENDPNGHGTHVAGTVIGNTYGLARKATAIAVRVLNAFGSGTTAGVVAGIVFTAKEHTPGKKSVANMSLGGGKSSALNDAVDAAIDEGVHFAVAAGNENQNACNVSPASSRSVTVAASNDQDRRASFSNWGECVEIFAPGEGVKSAYPGSPTSTRTLSGTSMAAPHVAGVMAKLLSERSMTPDEMRHVLQELASRDKMIDPRDTINMLLFHDCY